MLEFTFADDDTELRELARSVRRFAASRFTAVDPSFSRDDFRAMAELGLTGISLPERYGGSALNGAAIAAAVFELARAELGPAIYLGVHLMVSAAIARAAEGNGTPPDAASSAFDALLRELAAGEKLAAFCLTEAGAGSDAAALKTKAQLRGDHYVLNGEKIYITSAGHADVYLVFADTGGDGAAEISAFVVEKGRPGLTFGAPEKKMGCAGSPIASVSFQNCKIPLNALVGARGRGYRIALSGLNGGRVNIAAAACGVAARAIEIAAAHSRQRKQFGQPINDFQGVSFMLADMCTKLNASIHLTRFAARQLQAGKQSAAHASMAKCFATDSAMEITTDAVQVLGGAGYLQDYLVERLMRDAKMLQIVEGTNQIQRVVISRALADQT